MIQVSNNFPDIQSSRYKIEAVLGAGAVGTVYKAEDTVLSIHVAIKKLHKTALQTEAARFHREAKLAGTLKHGNVLSVLDFGLTDDEEPYLVLNFVEGVSLAERLHEKIIELPEAMDIFIQIARGLVHAHSKNVIHRDIKPSNIMLVTNAEHRSESVKIVDFGLAKSTTEGQELTKSGIGVGTPMYMSPEQIEGIDVDHRSDIYSFGCVMFEVFTGDRPFNADTLIEIVDMHMNHDHPSVRDHALYEVPQRLIDIIDKCLEKDREDRYKDAKALLEDLEKVAATIYHQDDAAHHEQGASNTVPKLDKRLVIASVVVLLLGLGIGTAAMTFMQPAKKKSVADTTSGNPYKFRNTHSNPQWYKASVPVNDDDLRAFIKLNKGRRINEIMMESPKVTAKGYRLLRHFNIGVVSIKVSPVSKQMLQAISQIDSLQLVRFDANTALDYSGLKYFENTPKLEGIDLHRNHIPKAGFEAIGNLPNLKILIIKECTGLGGNAMEPLKNLRHLERVDLDVSDVDDNGIKVLVGNPITTMSLYGTMIGDKSLVYLNEIGTLRTLNMHASPRLSLKGIDEFAKNHPQIIMHYRRDDIEGYDYLNDL